MSKIFVLSMLALGCGGADAAVPAPVSVIFDTDMWSDIDDSMALAMVHALQDRAEITVLAVTVAMDDKWCAPYVDLLNTFYGYPGIPIGVVKNGLTLDSFLARLLDSAAYDASPLTWSNRRCGSCP